MSSSAKLALWVQAFNWFKGKGSISSRVQLFQRFNCFTGSIGGNGLIDSRAQLLRGFNWCKDSIGSKG